MNAYVHFGTAQKGEACRTVSTIQRTAGSKTYVRIYGAWRLVRRDPHGYGMIAKYRGETVRVNV